MEAGNFLDGRTVQVKELKDHLSKEISGLRATCTKDELKQHIGELVEELIEKPAYENAGEEWMRTKLEICDVIENVDELRDVEFELLEEV